MWSTLATGLSGQICSLYTCVCVCVPPPPPPPPPPPTIHSQSPTIPTEFSKPHYSYTILYTILKAPLFLHNSQSPTILHNSQSPTILHNSQSPTILHNSQSPTILHNSLHNSQSPTILHNSLHNSQTPTILHNSQSPTILHNSQSPTILHNSLHNSQSPTILPNSQTPTILHNSQSPTIQRLPGMSCIQELQVKSIARNLPQILTFTITIVWPLNCGHSSSCNSFPSYYSVSLTHSGASIVKGPCWR